ncbi:MAG: hypothetical protein UHK54_03770, partial [Acutalibacteraceae bacterium]|nr:hypothetical protein [Acutalibacteraceae bacterium]
MVCQNCGKAQATTHIKRVVNGDTTEHHLCARCAGDLGYTDMFSGFAPLSLSDFFGDLLGDVSKKALGTKVVRCPKCGNKRIVGAGSFVEIPVPNADENQPDLRNPVQLLTVDRNALD